MLKFFKVLALSALLAIGANATDFLSKATGGALSDNSIGVKQLSMSEMKDVLGGYEIKFMALSDNEIMVMAQPDYVKELGFVFTADGSLDLEATRTSDKGLCKMGTSDCYYNDKTKSHLQLNRNRMQEFINGFAGEHTFLYNNLGYTVKREIKVEGGIRYPLTIYLWGSCI